MPRFLVLLVDHMACHRTLHTIYYFPPLLFISFFDESRARILNYRDPVYEHTQLKRSKLLVVCDWSHHRWQSIWSKSQKVDE